MVQDDSREIVLARICGLVRAKSRNGIDARTVSGFPVELKSTTTESVTTARDAGIKHIRKWRRQYWIIGKGEMTEDREDWLPQELFFAHPDDLEKFFRTVEYKIKRTMSIFDVAIKLAAKEMSIADISEMRKIIIARAGTLNCPSIPMSYIRNNCYKVEPAEAKRKVTLLVKKFPLPS